MRAFNLQTGEIEEEPRQDWETILTLNLSISSDLEPVWSLKSQRAEQLGQERSIAWKDRASIAPARLGNYVASSLSWTPGSVLNRLAEERPSLGAELVGAAREARASFGNQAGAQLGETLRIITETATSLGVPTGGNTQALLDAHSVSIGDGAIALHDARGVPLRSLGTGSVRLLIAGLQRVAAERAMWRRSIGSTLLLKGLEAEVVVVLEPEIMDARHLYVALTRGANQIVVCSATQHVNPAH